MQTVVLVMYDLACPSVIPFSSAVLANCHSFHWGDIRGRLAENSLTFYALLVLVTGLHERDSRRRNVYGGDASVAHGMHAHRNRRQTAANDEDSLTLGLPKVGLEGRFH